MSLTIAKQQDLRKVVMEFLALRYPNAYTADAIARMLTRRQVVDFPIKISDVVAACAWLSDEGFAKSVTDELSVIPVYSATSRGVAFYQQGVAAANPNEEDEI